MKPRLTIICPVYNEEATIPIFYTRARAVLDSLADRYETALLFSDNASTDRTREAIDELRRRDAQVFILSLSANVGYQRSVEAGLTHASGDLFVIIDVDCEDPPEMIRDFLQVHARGYDVVYGERGNRAEPRPLTAMRKLYYRLTRFLADDTFVIDMAEFCLMTDEVRRAILQSSNSFPFIRASIGRVGFRRIGIPYDRQERVGGQTHYNLLGMVKFAIAGILSSTTLPLRMTAYLYLPTTLLLAVLLGLWWAMGVASALLLAALAAFAYVGFALSALSLYLARAYKDGLKHPHHIVFRARTHLQPNAVEPDR